MSNDICPWWLGYLIANPVRRLWHDPSAILDSYLTAGMTVLEPGPGIGFFTLEMARQVGPTGRIVAVDIQPRMLVALRRRAEKAGLAERIDTRQAGKDRLGIDDLEGKVDFVLAFAVVHELPDVPGFFREVRRAMKPQGRVLFAEPRMHVKEEHFASSLQAAEQAGFRVEKTVAIKLSRSVVLIPST